MFDLGHYPAALTAGSSSLLGEVYRVSPHVVRDLDFLESVPDFYKHHRLTTPWGAAFGYMFSAADGLDFTGCSLVPNGDWRSSPASL